MEILFAYVLLLNEGYDLWEQYNAQLDELFLAEPQNEMYLYLESATDIERSLRYILSAKRKTDHEVFKKALMKLIGEIYLNNDLSVLTKRLYSLWNKLPGPINMQEPFFTFNYADDVLAHNGEKECRELLEKAIYHYDET